MKLVTDTREQAPLVFPKTLGVEYATETLPVGDYTAWHGSLPDNTIIERKSVSDLFNSFTSGYEAERNKIRLSKSLNLNYIIAVEATATQVLKGHSYWRGGEVREHKKSGLAMLRQLMTIQRKYGVAVWFCDGRREMAMRIQEYFLAWERIR